MRRPVRPASQALAACIAGLASALLLTTPASSAPLGRDDTAAIPAGPVTILPRLDQALPTAMATVAESPAQQFDVLRYWTPERMRTAVAPTQRLPRRDADALLPRLDGLLPNTGDRAPGTVDQQRTGRSPAAATAGGFRWNGGGAVTRATGRVFFTLDGGDYFCSATAVRSTNRDTVITAGHCLNAGPGNFASRWMFVPGYRNGGQPYGAWTARRLFTPTEWRTRGAIDYDIGFAVLNTRQGRHLTDVVGALPIGFNQPRGAYVHAFGYPAVGSYDGNWLYYCRDTPRPDRYGSADQGIACVMSEGSSGGPWLTGFNPRSGAGTVTSVNSFSYDDSPHVMWGPYLGNAARSLHATAQRS